MVKKSNFIENLIIILLVIVIVLPIIYLFALAKAASYYELQKVCTFKKLQAMSLNIDPFLKEVAINEVDQICQKVLYEKGYAQAAQFLKETGLDNPYNFIIIESIIALAAFGLWLANNSRRKK